MDALLDRFAGIRRNRLVLMDDTGEISYGFLWQASEQLAAELRHRTDPGRPVAICLDNGAGFLVALLATWKAKRTAFVADHRLPPADLARLTASAGAEAMIGTAGLIMLDVAVSAPVTQGGDMPLLMHSSGTTGFPRLLNRRREALFRDIDGVAAVNDVQPGDRILCPVAWSHAGGLQSAVIMSLWCGGTLVTSRLVTAGSMLRCIQNMDVDHLYATPFVFQQLARRGQFVGPRIPRTCVSMGSPLSSELYESVYANVGLAIRQAYGATDFGGISWATRDDDPVSVGRPLRGVDVRAGVGEDAPAEVIVRSKAGNLLDREDWFHTGDIGFIRGGLLYVRGRLDEVINVAGMKVLPTYVEAILRRHVGVADALVCQVNRLGRDACIGALVVSRRGARMTGVELRRWCEAHLTSFSVPTVIEMTGQLPVTRNGKPDRRQASDLLAHVLLADEDRSGRSGTATPSRRGFSAARQDDDSAVLRRTTRTVQLARRLLVDIDEEGIDLRNLSCYQMGIRDLLHCEGAAEVAQTMAMPIGLSARSNAGGFWQLATGFGPANPERGFSLNRGWRFVGHVASAPAALPRIIDRVRSGHPALICPAELRLPYFPAELNPQHVAIFARVEDDSITVYDDMPLPGLTLKMATVPLRPLLQLPDDHAVHWFYVERGEEAPSWHTELGHLLGSSVRSWSGYEQPDQGFRGLLSFIDWFRQWELDMESLADVERLTELFLSMRFEMSASHHILEVALRRTEELGGAEAAADVLRAAWKHWNAVILLLFAWKETSQVRQKPNVLSLLHELQTLEARAVDLLDVCRAEIA